MTDNTNLQADGCINPQQLCFFPEDLSHLDSLLDVVTEAEPGSQTPVYDYTNNDSLTAASQQQHIFSPIHSDDPTLGGSLESYFHQSRPSSSGLYLPVPELSSDLIDPSLRPPPTPAPTFSPGSTSVPVVPNFEYNDQERMQQLLDFNASASYEVPRQPASKRRAGQYALTASGGYRTSSIDVSDPFSDPLQEPYNAQQSNKRKFGSGAQSKKDLFNMSREPLPAGYHIPWGGSGSAGPRIKDYDPKKYTGPAAEPNYTFNVNTGKDSFDVDGNSIGTIYEYTRYKPLGNFGPFKYDSQGHLLAGITFDSARLFKFIKWHSLGSNLLFRIEKNPQKSQLRRPESCFNACRAEICYVDSRNHHIREGAIVVAVEEVWGRIARKYQDDSDPYFAAFYMHLECLEHLIDVAQLIKHGMLRTFPRRHLAKEPRTSNTEPNKLCLPEKTENCFRRFCRRVLTQPSWQGYRKNVLDSLITQLWLTNTRKDKHLLGVRPHIKELPEEIAYRLSVNKGRDPGWGGSRFVGLSVTQADKIVSVCGRDYRRKLHGSKREAEQQNRRLLQSVEERNSAFQEQFSDGEEFMRQTWGSHCSVRDVSPPPYHQQQQQQKTRRIVSATGVRRSPRSPKSVNYQEPVDNF